MNAFNILFSLYGREDVEVLSEVLIHKLANRSSRAALHAAELTQQTVMMGLQENRRLLDLGIKHKEQGRIRPL